MAGYHDAFAAGEARREKILKRVALGLLLAAIAGIALYFSFRNYREDKQVKQFVQSLQDKQFEQAYALWGCTKATPCAGYSLANFLQDWGPESIHKGNSQMKLGLQYSCSNAVVQEVNFPDAKVLLYVDRSDLMIGFAPWTVELSIGQHAKRGKFAAMLRSVFGDPCSVRIPAPR